MSRQRLRASLRSNRRQVLIVCAAVLVVALVFGGRFVYQRVTTNRITGYFASTTGLYVGDSVRVLGVPVGRIDAIRPGRDATEVAMSVRSSVKIPADTRAVVVAPTLVSARFVQLAPVYRGGPTLRDGAEIPLRRTAVPVEWDDILTQLKKLSTAIGPTTGEPGGPLGRALDTAAANLDGNGSSIRDALRQLSQTVGLLSDGRSDLFATVRNLQAFVSALAESNTQIVQFGGRLASVSKVLATSSDELGTAFDELDVALGEVQRFVTDNRATLSESIARLGDATKIIVDKRPQLEQVLHIAPTALANFYQIYQPAQGSLSGVVSLSNFRSPVSFLCGAVEAMQSNDSKRSADLCAQYLTPVLSTLAMNYPPFLANPATGLHAFPEQLRYSPPSLATTTVPRSLGGLMMPGGSR